MLFCNMITFTLVFISRFLLEKVLQGCYCLICLLQWKLLSCISNVKNFAFEKLHSLNNLSLFAVSISFVFSATFNLMLAMRFPHLFGSIVCIIRKILHVNDIVDFFFKWISNKEISWNYKDFISFHNIFLL